ncbi:MAG: hypothetical protein PHE68_01165 [Candidatus Peribacteraceae bacterium]|nr:hypothetical protein [Candidatus Peribacteraceae bacterium]MDD5074412.1 hypothetical protein [Candidatus Peribacteraceae bacterium]
MKTFSNLFSESWVTFKKFIRPILIGAVVFGTVMGVAQMSLERNTTLEINKTLGVFGLDAQRMQELQRRVALGDEQAVQEFTDAMKNVQEKKDQLGEEVFARMMVQSTLSTFAGMTWFAPLMLVISIFSFLFFLLLAVTGVQDPVVLIKQTAVRFFPFLGLSLWVMVRSFIWIPLIGIIIAIIVGPRLALAPVIMLTEKKGVFESASLSYTRSQGYWGKIIGNSFLAGLLVAIVLIVAGIILSIGGPTIGTLLKSIFNMMGVAFNVIFIFKLSQAVMARA